MSDTEAQKVAQLRELIPATAAGIYLDTAYRGPLPAETAAAMREADDWELRVGRATEGRAEDMEQRVEEARSVLAALIGADPSEIFMVGARPEFELFALVDPDSGELSVPPLWASVDATLAAGAIPLDVASLQADLVFIPGDRWLLGPEGVGAMWVRRGVAGVATSVRDSDLGRTQVLGLARSVGWLEMYVGLDWIYERGRRLARQLHDALSGADGVEVLTPPGAMATTVMFRFAAWPVDEALEELRRRVFAIVGATDGGAAVRASVAWFNTEEEIDRFGRAVTEIAAHTPETLPRRPNLIIQ